jgi:DNA-binding PadR family transcriptional regulator
MFTARSALAVLAESQIGCSESLMLAHGFPTELITKLVEAGFATVTTEIIHGGKRAIDVKRLKITDAGREALADR